MDDLSGGEKELRPTRALQEAYEKGYAHGAQDQRAGDKAESRPAQERVAKEPTAKWPEDY